MRLMIKKNGGMVKSTGRRGWGFYFVGQSERLRSELPAVATLSATLRFSFFVARTEPNRTEPGHTAANAVVSRPVVHDSRHKHTRRAAIRRPKCGPPLARKSKVSCLPIVVLAYFVAPNVGPQVTQNRTAIAAALRATIK